MKDVKRYNHGVTASPYPMSRMYEHLDGKYVEYSDYEALQQRLDEAEKLKADFKKAMKLFEDAGLDNLLWKLLDTITKGE